MPQETSIGAVLPSAASAPVAAAPPRPAARKGIDPRYLSAGFATLILVVGQQAFGIVGGLERLALSLGCALGAEIVLSRWLRGTWPNLASAYISGISVAILSKPTPGLLWPFVVCSLLAISSKYVLAYKNRHLWNPTNFSVSALLLLAPDVYAVLSFQWGNSNWMVAFIWVWGFIVVRRAKVFHITATYLVAFVALSAIRSLMLGERFGNEVAPVTGPMYQLFMFFMVTDPRTIVSRRKWQIVVVILVAIVESAIRTLHRVDVPLLQPLLTAPPLFALATVGPLALFIELKWFPPAPRR